MTDPFPLPPIIRWHVDAGEIWMDTSWPIEIEYRVHDGPGGRGQVLSEREFQAVAETMSAVRAIASRIEAGEPIVFARPTRDDDPPF